MEAVESFISFLLVEKYLIMDFMITYGENINAQKRFMLLRKRRILSR